MGWAKDRGIMELERGYGSSDKVVCHNCVGDYYLKQYIKENGEQSSCDYCGSNDVGISLEDLMDPIMNGIRQEYEDANGCMGHDGREGGFLGAETYDSYDLIHDVIWDELNFQSSVLSDDVSNLISDAIIWCQRDPYGNLPYIEDFYTWEQYVDTCKNLAEHKNFDLAFDDDLRVYKSADEILVRICEGIRMLELVEDIPSDTGLWRARAHTKFDTVDSTSTLGPPKEDKAGCNRMNPAKISTFYGAFDKQTALAEIAGQKGPLRTVGIFYNQIQLTVINFSKLNGICVPSLFDIENNDKRMLLIFLKRFNREISKSIVSGKEQEYLPTQKLIEYLKEKMTTTNGFRINGVIYDSSLQPKGICCALFIDWRQCSDEKGKILWLNRASLECIR